MPKVVTNGRERVIVFDQKDEQVSRERSAKMHTIAKTLRDNGLNVYRCLKASTDPVNIKLFNISPDDDTKSVIEICFPQNSETPLSNEKLNSLLNENAAVLLLKGIKILNKKLYKDPDEPDKVVGKFLISVS